MKEITGKTVREMAKAAAAWLTALFFAGLVTGCGMGGVKVTDTILWMNGTHAVATAINGGDWNMFGMRSVDHDTLQGLQQYLKDSWEVADRDSAEETLAWLSGEGHHGTFGKTMGILEEAGIGAVSEEERAAFIYGKFEMTEEEARFYAKLYGAYETKGTAAILAWDYSRAMALLENCYSAGYFTETEALDKSLELAGEIQAAYGSWDDFVESYLLGYEYWSGESSGERREIYEGLKAAGDGPYHLEWGMALEKSW